MGSRKQPTEDKADIHSGGFFVLGLDTTDP